MELRRLAGRSQCGPQFGQGVGGAVICGVVAEDGAAHAMPVWRAAHYAVVGDGRINHAHSRQLQCEAAAQAKAHTAHAFAPRAQQRCCCGHISGGLRDV